MLFVTWSYIAIRCNNLYASRRFYCSTLSRTLEHRISVPWRTRPGKPLKYERFVCIPIFQFAKANVKLIVEKLRQTLKPVYKEFLQLCAPAQSIDGDLRVLPYEKLRYTSPFSFIQLPMNESIRTAWQEMIRQAKIEKSNCNLLKRTLLQITNLCESEHAGKYARCWFSTLDQRLPGRWIGRAGLISSSARSSHLDLFDC